MADDDRDLIDDDPQPSASDKRPASSSAPPKAPAAAGPSNTSRRSFLFGAAAGAVGGVVASAGIASIAGQQGGTGGLPSAGTTGGRGGAAGEPKAGDVVSLKVNGRVRELYVKANRTLAEVLREDLELTGTKIGCNMSECSACTVLVNGVSVNSCSEMAIRLNGAEITTIEGLEAGGKLHPVQEAFMKEMGFQCGFCTPGQIMQTVGLLKKIPNPTEAQIAHHMAGNLCKCSAYPFIMASVKEAAKTFKA